MKNNLIALRYAKAILQNVKPEELENLRSDVIKLNTVFHQKNDFLKLFDSVLFPFPKRLEAAEEITHDLAKQEMWKNLFEILLKKNRFSLLDDILRVLDEEILKLNNKIRVKLTIAHKHDDAVMKQIEEEIKTILKKDVEITIEINPEILGGFVAETSDFLIDGSVKHNLIKLIKIKKK